MLAAVVAAFDRLDAETQVIVALRWHQELPLDVAAKQLGISVERARRLHDAGVREIHQAMLRQVQAEGIGPRQPALPLPPVWVRSGDCCRAGEAGGRVKRCGDCGELLPVEAFSWRDRAKGYRVPYCPPCVSIRAGAAYSKRREAALTA
jgi:hypothetical protein